MKIEKELLEKIVSESNNRKECFIKLGLHPSSNNSYRVLNYWLNVYEIDTKHFVAFGDSGLKKKRSCMNVKLTDILNGSHPLYTTSKLKSRLLNEHVLEHVCSVCNLTDWMGKPIPLDLDHINGIPTDHRLENLRLICRNCHAQTENFCGRNVKNTKGSKRKQENMRGEEKRNISKKLTIDRIDMINNSEIDFSKFGWVNDVAKLLDMKPQKINCWMKNKMSKFYEEKCFKRKQRKI